MMKIAMLLTNLLLGVIFLISGCSFNQTENVSAASGSKTDTRKILIVYLSRTNNTKAVAEIIQKHVGGKLVAIELENPYPENYQTTVAQVAKENETGFLPKLKTSIGDIRQYDVVFVGFPTWGMKLPPPVKSFLKQHNLSGKTVIPFNTNAGYGIGSTFEALKELCPKSKVLEGFSTKGGVERDGQMLIIKDEKEKQTGIQVKSWLQTLKMI